MPSHLAILLAGEPPASAKPPPAVLVMDEGNGARQILGLDPGAIRSVVVGVVDEVRVGG